SCGPEWGKRTREAVAFFLEKERAERPEVLILRHGLVIFETLELERIASIRMNRELLRLDLPEARWNRYCGPGGCEYGHAVTPNEQAALLKKSNIVARPMRPVGGGKLFRGYERSWFVEALREYESSAPDDAGRLRLITASLGLSLLATSPAFVTAVSQVPGPVVGAGLARLGLGCCVVL